MFGNGIITVIDLFAVDCVSLWKKNFKATPLPVVVLLRHVVEYRVWYEAMLHNVIFEITIES